MMKLNLEQLLEFFLQGDDEDAQLDMLQRDRHLPKQIGLARAIVETLCDGPGAAVRQRLQHAVELANQVRSQSQEAPSRNLFKLLASHASPGAYMAMRRGTPSFDVINAGTFSLTVGKPQDVSLGNLQVSLTSEAPLEGEGKLTVRLTSGLKLEGASAILWKDSTDIQRASFDADGRARFRWITPGPRTLRLDAGETAGIITLESSSDPT